MKAHQLTVLLVAGAIVLGSISGRAQPIAAFQIQMQPTKNEPPLKPAGAAGIRQAQGSEDIDVWFISGLALAAIVWILVDNDDDDSSDSTSNTK
jgi:hypothetical protein